MNDSFIIIIIVIIIFLLAETTATTAAIPYPDGNPNPLFKSTSSSIHAYRNDYEKIYQWVPNKAVSDDAETGSFEQKQAVSS